MEAQIASSIQPHGIGHESFKMDQNYAALLKGDFHFQEESDSCNGFPPPEPSRSLREGELHRSRSEDRKLNEQEQFYEAVGEPATNSQCDLQVIDDSDDGDDSSGCEVQAEKVPTHKREIPWHVSYYPFQPVSDFCFHLPSSNAELVYKGICSDRLEQVTMRGFQRGNYSQLHRKAWLEVSDPKHRYGKNLRLYYKHWGSLGYPTNKFFDWLDSHGEAEGQPLPDLPECPRAKLDSDTVLYITDSEVTRSYALSIVSNQAGRGRVLDVDGVPVRTGPDGWIFVLRDQVIYGAQKITAVTKHSKQRFHHSSFFGGKAVAAAGIFLTDDDGFLTHLYPHSGHYRPGEADMQRILYYLCSENVDLKSFQVDMQQIIQVSRESPADGKCDARKSKKMSSLHLQPASYVADYISHKARCIGEGVFQQIHRIDNAAVTTVSEALRLIDKVGYRKSASEKKLNFHVVGPVE